LANSLACGRALNYFGSFFRKTPKRFMRETITAALKHATKAQDKRRISTLRLVSAAIKDRDIAARTAGKTQATDAELLELFAKMIKQREESERIYADAGRAELAKQEGEEIVIIREFLPKQLSDKEMEKAIADAIAKAGAASVKDMGKVMAELKARYAGQMDFAKASASVKAKLG
jgi:uncharacterized protein YqeY